MQTRTESSTILRQPWLNIARVAWVVMSLTALVAMLVGTLISTREQLPTCTTPQASCAPWSLSQEDLALAQRSGLPHELMLFALYASSVLPKILFFGVGLIIFSRKSDDWMALMLSLMLTLFVTEGVQNLGAFMSVVNVLYVIARCSSANTLIMD